MFEVGGWPAGFITIGKENDNLSYHSAEVDEKAKA
jgi:hypothetical protein